MVENNSEGKKMEELLMEDLPSFFQEQSNDIIPWQAVNIQCDYSDVANAIKKCCQVDESAYDFLQQKIQTVFTGSSNERALTCLSVRSCFDLFLQAKKYPRGSEILITAVNIPDMYQIIIEHGLIPVPFEYDLETMHPSVNPDEFRSLVNEKTKCILFAYLFGIIYDIQPYLNVIQGMNIDIIEDTAQSFQGPKQFTGHKNATLTLFSLGMIKVQTCYYGSVGIIRNNEKLFIEMAEIQQTYQLFTKKAFLKRIITGGLLKTLMNHAPVMSTAIKLTNMMGKEREDYYVSLVRGFKPGEDYLGRYRFKPCGALLSFIYERLVAYNEYSQTLFNRKLQIAVEVLTKAGIFVPGNKIKERGFWLFPIIVPNRVLFAAFMNKRGVCAYRGATQLRYVKPLKGYKDCERSKWFMDHVIYLPIHGSVPDKHFQKILDVTIESYNILMKYLSQPHIKKPIEKLTVELYSRAKL